MNRIKAGFLSIAVAAALSAFIPGVAAKDLVLLHSNDTHSLIEPGPDGMGGVLQRKAIMDSVRKAEKNVITVDAGDVVQGTLYFKFFKGDVEYPLMDMMGYDIRILGNHEFDNGMKELAKYYKNTKGTPLSSNYDFAGTDLEGVFETYLIKKVDGKKIGFIGLNIDPESIIAKDNIDVNFKDVVKTANELAAWLKNDKKCDLVVAVTHIGYVKENEKTTDVELAQESRDIDIIIGGHSHTLIDPANPDKYPSIVRNSEGRPVIICQTGKSGRYLGYVKIDLDNLEQQKREGSYDYRLIPVTDRFPQSALDGKIKNFIAPYKVLVDSVNSNVIGTSLYDMSNRERTGRFPNWIADFAQWYGTQITDSLNRIGQGIGDVDFSIMNVGGIRSSMAKGDVTEGQILSTFPFSNHIVLTKLKGKDVIDAMRVAARKGGEAVSDELRVVADENGNLIRVVLNNEELDPEKDYLMATIDYLAWGNDDLTGLGKGEWQWRDEREMSLPLLDYVRRLTSLGLPVAADDTSRFVTVSGK